MQKQEKGTPCEKSEGKRGILCDQEMGMFVLAGYALEWKAACA